LKPDFCKFLIYQQQNKIMSEDETITVGMEKSLQQINDFY
jgi:hypothetical protein